MKFSKKILKNGLRLVTIPMKDNPTATVLVLVEAGSKYEDKRVNGISHFLEHMCFKGTTKRPKAIDISKELDALGSQYNAFTAQEYTGYYAKSDAKHFHKIFDVVSDIYLNSTFPDMEMEKEKGVIIEEINMYEDMPNRHVQDLFMKLLYGDQPAGWNIAGEKSNIVSMKRDDFVKYKNSHYLPEATVLVNGLVYPLSFGEAELTLPPGFHLVDIIAPEAQRTYVAVHEVRAGRIANSDRYLLEYKVTIQPKPEKPKAGAPGLDGGNLDEMAGDAHDHDHDHDPDQDANPDDDVVDPASSPEATPLTPPAADTTGSSAAGTVAAPVEVKVETHNFVASQTFNTFLTSLSPLYATRVFEDVSPEKLAEFGLNESPAVLEFAEDPKDWVTLWPRTNIPEAGDREAAADTFCSPCAYPEGETSGPGGLPGGSVTVEAAAGARDPLAESVTGFGEVA